MAKVKFDTILGKLREKDVSASPLTTKGDVYTYDTTDARLGVGSNDEVLTADSAQGTGMKWAAAAGGAYSRSATLVVAANDSKDTTNADYFCDGTDDQVQINQAISDLPANGGRVILMEGLYTTGGSIILNKERTTLEGQGYASIIKLKDSHNATIDIVDATRSYCEVKNLKVDGNKANQNAGTMSGIVLSGNDTTCFGCWVTQCRDNGIFASAARARIIDNRSNYNTDNGIWYYGADSVVTRNILSNNSKAGMRAEGNTSTVAENTSSYNSQQGILVRGYIINVFGNACTGNVGSSIEIYGGSKNNITGNVVFSTTQTNGGILVRTDYNTISNNYLNFERYHGIVLDGASYCVVSGNLFYNVARSGYNLIFLKNTSTYNVITGNNAYGSSISVPNYCYRENAAVDDYNLVEGNIFTVATTTDISTQGTHTQTYNNITQNHYHEQKLVIKKNTSGGALAAGDLVVLKAVAGGDEVTTTTAQGDDMIFGMAVDTINDNATGLIQVLGKTTALKVDGTTDIAIGDFIGNFTTAKIGMKAAAGDMAIAIALEGYTTDDSSGVIDALLITPRKI